MTQSVYCIALADTLLSQLSVNISNVEIHTFWGSEQFVETATSIGSP